MTQQVLDRPTSSTSKPQDREFPPLTAADRCDGQVVSHLHEGGRGPCGAQAFVRVVMPSGYDLLFCGHCMGAQTIGKNATGYKSEVYATRRQRFEAAGARIIDDAYATINHKPSESSQAKGF